jgi:transposase
LRASKLDVAYKQEKDVDVKERILLVRRIVEDEKHIEDVAKELHRCRAWAYKWYKRYNEDGLDGLKIRKEPVDLQMYQRCNNKKIRQELAESNTGWDFRQVMDLIYKKTGVRYHEVHIYRLLHKWGFKPKVLQKRFVNSASTKEKKRFKKE